jgi:hypothetical protein
MKNRYFSVGEYCGPAEQIKKITSNQEHFFFDSLVTPLEALRFMNQANDHFLAEDNWKIVDWPSDGSEGENTGIRLKDHYSGLLFQHEFETTPDYTSSWGNSINANLVNTHLPIAKSKFIYLKNKFITQITQENSRIVILRCDNLIETLDQANATLRVLKEVFWKINPSIKFVIASEALTIEQFHDDHFIFKLQKSRDWMGDTNSYKSLIRKAENHFDF